MAFWISRPYLRWSAFDEIPLVLFAQDSLCNVYYDYRHSVLNTAMRACWSLSVANSTCSQHNGCPVQNCLKSKPNYCNDKIHRDSVFVGKVVLKELDSWRDVELHVLSSRTTVSATKLTTAPMGISLRGGEVLASAETRKSGDCLLPVFGQVAMTVTVSRGRERSTTRFPELMSI